MHSVSATYNLKDKFGHTILTEEYIQTLRDADFKKNNPFTIIAQAGAQERMLSQDVDILIGGGNRGGSKSFSLLLEGLRDVYQKNFNGIIFRKEKPDLDTLIETSKMVYDEFGVYNRSDTQKVWLFDDGGRLRFNYYNDDYSDFKDRFQGHQYCYIGVDEITQMPYNKFKYMLTCNRNAHGLRNRFFGTCNPDPDSWVRKFIDWWIDDEGYPIPERNCVVRYCFMDGDNPDNIYWGNTRDEVYEQCKHIIDPLWKPEYEKLGWNKAEMFVKSVTFCKAGLEENLKLLTSDPSYVANLAGQDEEQRMRDLDGNWNFKNAGDDLVKAADLDNMFHNARQEDDGMRRASADIALQGGDSLVMWLWVGWHIADLYVCRVDSQTAVGVISAKLQEWGVLEENFTYDKNGIGGFIEGFFPDAVPFVNNAAPVAKSRKDEKGIKYLYRDLKSQCAYLFYKKVKALEMSIDPDLLRQKFNGQGFSNTPLYNILQKERKCIRRAEKTEDRGWGIIDKKEMKKYVGHSPDYVESLFYRMIFEVQPKRHKEVKGLWMI